MTDTDGDGLIDIQGELQPMIEGFLKNYSLYAPKIEGSYVTGDLIAKAAKPTLILQGVNDGWVSKDNAAIIHDAAPDLVTVKLYEGLGHALSPTEDPAEDAFNVMDAAPIADLAAWILQ
jgi:pimeloyl-ACP methyl ester carboxylesterase